MSRTHIAASVLLLLTAACQRTPDLAQEPIGTEVQVTRDIPIDHVADLRLVSNAVPDLPPKATYREVHVPATERASIRLLSRVSSETSAREDAVTAEVTRPIVIDGVEVIPAGATLKGVVTRAQPSGKVKGRAAVAIRFTHLTVRSLSYPIAAIVSRVAPATKAADAKKIALPAAGGAVVGAVLGGKKGAAIGAAVAGGAGTAVVLATPGKPVVLRQGTLLRVALGQPIEVRVPLP